MATRITSAIQNIGNRSGVYDIDADLVDPMRADVLADNALGPTSIFDAAWSNGSIDAMVMHDPGVHADAIDALTMFDPGEADNTVDGVTAHDPGGQDRTIGPITMFDPGEADNNTVGPITMFDPGSQNSSISPPTMFDPGPQNFGQIPLADLGLLPTMPVDTGLMLLHS